MLSRIKTEGDKKGGKKSDSTGCRKQPGTHPGVVLVILETRPVVGFCCGVSVKGEDGMEAKAQWSSLGTGMEVAAQFG